MSIKRNIGKVRKRSLNSAILNHVWRKLNRATTMHIRFEFVLHLAALDAVGIREPSLPVPKETKISKETFVSHM